ncbi:putative outer membrane starch-binding protein [Arcticibacter tournemirensis]|nr:RagB/SusD family nutrient uptake outer membrane protein [Arcticibacter tournemirensis]TQM51326.1 putative outer membrane starch-binding protein [Arcticibacter tournemirensis]
MRIKSILIIVTVIGLITTFIACQKDFLQIPAVSGSTTIDSTFGTTEKALLAVRTAYKGCLSQGLPYRNDPWNAMIQDNMTGSLFYGHAWGIARNIVISGLNSTSTNEDMEGFNSNYNFIRQANLIRENINKVRDMSDADKAIIKAEMKALIAYRYCQMFIMYGGVPIVSHSLTTTDDLAIPRSSAKAVLDSVVTWCDEALPVLPSEWPGNWEGRMTKAAVLSVKAKIQLFAARPLFNTASPYLSLGERNDLICLGNVDPDRWKTAALTAEAVIREAETNAAAYIIDTNNPLDDYGTATSTPSNPEVLLAFKFVNTSGDNGGWNTLPMTAFYYPRINGEHSSAAGFTLLPSQLENYYKQDGTDQTWPALDAITPFADYLKRMDEMEPRFKADFMPYERSAWNNPGDANWSNTSIGLGYSNGAARSVKFYYKAGTRRWFEFPIFRLAFAYLAAAEAYNEMGQATDALLKLNKIHERAGLPAITETDRDKLRLLIQREWAIEFHKENFRLHEMKHWKLPNIGNGLIGGPVRGFGYNNNTTLKTTGNTNYSIRIIYQGFWSPKQYLNPFPQSEINKGYLIQNPGY